MNRTNRWVVLAALLALAACGGGGGSAPETPAPTPVADAVPDEASASVAAMKKWLLQVTTTQPDERDPLDVARFAPPQPDDTEPEALP